MPRRLSKASHLFEWILWLCPSPLTYCGSCMGAVQEMFRKMASMESELRRDIEEKDAQIADLKARIAQQQHLEERLAKSEVRKLSFKFRPSLIYLPPPPPSLPPCPALSFSFSLFFAPLSFFLSLVHLSLFSLPPKSYRNPSHFLNVYEKYTFFIKKKRKLSSG